MATQPIILIVLSISLIHFMFWYAVSSKLNYYSLVDVVWAYTFPVISICFLVLLPFDPRLLLLSIMLIMWGLRLGTHLVVRLFKHYPQEDGRYIELKEKWQKNKNISFFLFYCFQSISVLFLTTPLILVAASPIKSFGAEVYIGLLIWIVAWAGESIADRQLQSFRANPMNKDEVCNIGLWKYSRHPNYFFEWVMWIAYAILASGTENAVWAILSPAMMLLFLTKITGIPYTEKQSLKSRGDKFKEYQRTTSAFIPWFPKN